MFQTELRLWEMTYQAFLCNRMKDLLVWMVKKKLWKLTRRIELAGLEYLWKSFIESGEVTYMWMLDIRSWKCFHLFLGHVWSAIEGFQFFEQFNFHYVNSQWKETSIYKKSLWLMKGPQSMKCWYGLWIGEDLWVVRLRPNLERS